VRDVETGELRCVGSGFADGGDTEGSSPVRRRREIPRFARNDEVRRIKNGQAIGDDSNGVLTG